MRWLWRCLFLSLLTSGCNAYSYGHCDSQWPRASRPFCVLAAEAEERSAHEREEQAAIAAAEATPLYVPHVAPLPARVTEAAPVHRAFDATAATTALHDVDLAPCAEAARGYGHAQVTFGAAGDVSRVAIDAPAGLEAGAIHCIGERLAAVTAPPFDGADVTVGATFYLR